MDLARQGLPNKYLFFCFKLFIFKLNQSTRMRLSFIIISKFVIALFYFLCSILFSYKMHDIFNFVIYV